MKKIYIILSALTIIILILLDIFYLKNNTTWAENKCNSNIIEKEVVWSSMYPLLNNGAKINFYSDYYNKCLEKPKNWDIILYNYAWNKIPVIKVIRATENDTITNSWNLLYINWEILKNSNSDIYNFSNPELKMIMLFIKDWKVPEGSFLIFWDNINNSIDSRKFWAINIKDILGKFETIKK